MRSGEAEVEDLIRRATERHREILERVRQNTPEDAREGLDRAIQNAEQLRERVETREREREERPDDDDTATGTRARTQTENQEQTNGFGNARFDDDRFDDKDGDGSDDDDEGDDTEMRANTDQRGIDANRQ